MSGPWEDYAPATPATESGPWEDYTAAPTMLDRAKGVASDVGDFYKRAGEYRDTQFGKAMGGIAGMPRTTADAVKWGADKLGIPPRIIAGLPFIGPAIAAGSMMPTGQELGDKMLATRPDMTQRGINPVVDAGVQSVMGGPVLGAAGKLGPLVNFSAGAGSETAGQLAHEYAPEWETPARIFGAIAGGGGGAGLGAGARRISNTAKAAVEPFMAPGRDALVGRALNGAAADPVAAARNLEGYQISREAYPEVVPGFKIDAGKASRDPGLMQLAEIAGAKNPAMRAQYTANNEALTSALDKVTAGGDPKAFIAELAQHDTAAAMRAQAALDALPKGVDPATAGQAIQTALRGRYDALVSARKEASDPLYAAARGSSTPVNPWPLMTETADLAAATKGEPKSLVDTVRGLLFRPDGTADRTAAGMMATRDAVGDMQGNPSLGNYSKSLLQDMKGKIDDVLSVVPEEQQARATFQKFSKPLEPFDPKLGNLNAAAVIKKDPFGKEFLMEPDAVPSRFFRPGDTGGATMREFFDARGKNPQATQAMQGYIADKARGAPDVGAFVDRHSPAIDSFNPSFRRSLDDAAAAQGNAAYWKKSPATPFINGDLDAAVKSTLGAPDSAKRLQALRMQIGGSPEAVGGMQRAIIDDFKKAAGSSVQKDGAGEPMLQAAAVSKWMEANRGPVSNVLTPEQLGVMREIKKHLSDQAQTVPGRIGSPTYDRLATESIVGALMHPGLAKLPIFHVIHKGLGLAYGGANEATMNRLYEVMADPAAARALMMKATPGNVKLAEPVLSRIGSGVAAAAISQSGGRDAQ